MAKFNGPKIVTNGLILCLDAANRKSYPGSGTAWTDLSGRGNNGTLTNGPTFDANNAGSIVFDGTNDYATIPLDLSSYDQISISLWSKVRSHNNVAKIILELTSNYNLSSGGFALVADDGDQGGNYSAFTKTSNYLGGWFAKPSVNTWHHWAVNFVRKNNLANNGVEVFIDNVKQSFTLTLDVSSTTNFNNSTLYVASRNGTGIFADALLNDICIYNRALSRAEVEQNFNATRYRFGI